jgi:hypothetical protein
MNKTDDDFAARARGPASTRRADLRARAWILFLLDATMRTGIAPISKLRFHRLAYFTNCLARIYGVPAVDERIVKFRRGPYYPDMQWHLDRLVGQQLADMSHVNHFVDDHGAWMDARYRINRRGVSAADNMKAVATLAGLASFLLQLTTAYASHADDSLDELVLADVTYENERHGVGVVIDFSRLRDNHSARTAASFAAIAREPRAVTLEDQIHLYTEYVERRRARGQIAR